MNYQDEVVKLESGIDDTAKMDIPFVDFIIN